MNDDLQRAQARIRAILSRSPVPEDADHAEDVLARVVRRAPHADAALRLAALAHDIERALPTRKVQRSAFGDYDAFKAAHAANSAVVLREILDESGVSPSVSREACRLVRAHEVGGDPRSDLLNDADSLSFFAVNLVRYLAREGPDEALRRCRWGYGRLSSDGREQLSQMLAQREPALPDMARALVLKVVEEQRTP